MQVGDIMTRDVKTVSADDTFADAARILHDNSISSVVIKDNGAASGIVTERDLVNVVAEGLDPTAVRIGDRMTTELATVESRTDIAEAAQLMATRRIRHLPIVDKGALVGIISIRDLTTWAVKELTGGHELPDLERSQAALSAAVEAKKDE
ncbi:MAG TPA: CBS domain-containing protein [Actinomycetota bacterium]|jgi:CBS domain-containing protein|nr:CBS domain-containing protein [Actinomycetota bacterium]